MYPKRWFLTHILNSAYVGKYYDDEIQFFRNVGVNPAIRIFSYDQNILTIHDSISFHFFAKL